MVIQTENNCASDAALARTVGPDDHVEVRAGAKLGVVVGNKVV